MADGEKPVDEKLSHQTVRYERPSTHPLERCGNCENFISGPPHRCKGVASPIQTNSWCTHWEAK